MFVMPPFIAASILKFDDNEKQGIYKAISFEEVNDQIVELKVGAVFVVFFPM